jgi:hypothetical protein
MTAKGYPTPVRQTLNLIGLQYSGWSSYRLCLPGWQERDLALKSQELGRSHPEQGAAQEAIPSVS